MEDIKKMSGATKKIEKFADPGLTSPESEVSPKELDYAKTILIGQGFKYFNGLPQDHF